MKRRLIIDTDPGIDDAQAIMLAAAHPDITIEALTVVAGNIGLEGTVANACTILDMLGLDVPVYPGCQSALVRPAAEDAAHVHGSDGLGDVGFPQSGRVKETTHAAVALVQLANASPRELTLVAIGPLTNLAVALKLDPQLPQKFKELIIMGGAIHGRGNASPAAEFNIYADPEAAHLVFETWPELTLFSWETTEAHAVAAAQLQEWLALDTPQARFFQQITANFIARVRREYKRETFIAADPLAMAVAVEPAIVTKMEKHYVAIELHGQHTRGQTVVDWRDRSGRRPQTNVVLEIDLGRYCELMSGALGDPK